MPEATPLPKSPNDMPREVANSDTFMRNAFASTMSAFDSVTIDYCRDDDCECDDEPRGEWSVAVRTVSGQSFIATHANFVNALWYVLGHAGAADRSEHEKWQRQRAAALAKLTPDEQRLLRVR